MPDSAPQDPLYAESIIPLLYGKIGSLTVRVEVLVAENQQLRAQLADKDDD